MGRKKEAERRAENSPQKNISLQKERRGLDADRATGNGD
jgi:hypothetical protein